MTDGRPAGAWGRQVDRAVDKAALLTSARGSLAELLVAVWRQVLHSGAPDMVPLLQEGATGNQVIQKHDIDG